VGAPALRRWTTDEQDDGFTSHDRITFQMSLDAPNSARVFVTRRQPGRASDSECPFIIPILQFER